MFKLGAALVLAMISVTALALGAGADKDPQPVVDKLLAAADAGDPDAVEQVIDRPAVRADLRRQLENMARANGVEVEGGPPDPVLDRMIGPEAIRQAAATVAGDLKLDGKFRACLTDGVECVLTFARGGGHPGWRLVGMQAPHEDGDLQIQ